MTPSATQCIPAQFNLGTLKGRDVITNFAGGRITSDAGIVLMAELEKKLKLQLASLNVSESIEIYLM
jgi:hypothetical protein